MDQVLVARLYARTVLNTVSRVVAADGDQLAADDCRAEPAGSGRHGRQLGPLAGRRVEALHRRGVAGFGYLVPADGVQVGPVRRGRQVIARNRNGGGVVPARAVENLCGLDQLLGCAGPPADDDDLVPHHRRRAGRARMMQWQGRRSSGCGPGSVSAPGRRRPPAHCCPAARNHRSPTACSGRPPSSRDATRWAGAGRGSTCRASGRKTPSSPLHASGQAGHRPPRSGHPAPQQAHTEPRTANHAPTASPQQPAAGGDGAVRICTVLVDAMCPGLAAPSRA